MGLNSEATAVTPGAPFRLNITARMSPASVGSGYFALIWFNAAGNEPSREISLFRPTTQPVATVKTHRDGTFTVDNPLDADWYEVTAEYPGSDKSWPSVARAPGIVVGNRRPPQR
jgi:hypothetical protein